jgi:hypothetical protein
MGASNFEQIEFGKTVDEAYRNACDEAVWDNGHDAYNGTISTTRGFIVIPRRGRKVYNIINEILDDDDSRIQKWGPAGAIILTGKDAKEYRERHHLVGKKGVVVMFFGWAAE